MRHLREDYDAIQPWPVKRPHWAKIDGRLVTVPSSLTGDVPAEPIIPDDEPVFLLRGIDPSGSVAVQAWAADVAARGGDPELVARVREWAQEMVRYSLDHGKRVADVPDGLLR